MVVRWRCGPTSTIPRGRTWYTHRKAPSRCEWSSRRTAARSPDTARGFCRPSSTSRDADDSADAYDPGAMALAPLTRLRPLCLGFPDAHEVEAWGEPTFRVRNKLFAMFSGSGHHGAGRSAVWCKAPDRKSVV